MSKFNADINSAGDGWIQVTISGDTANTLTEAQIASSLSTLPIAGEGPEGWQLVPTVATLEMEHAAVARVKPFHDEDWYRIMPKDLFRLAWKALLNAAPTPPSSPGKDDGQEVDAVKTVWRLADAIDPELSADGGWRDQLLGEIHADLENRGRRDKDFAVTVHHRNIVISAVSRALRGLPSYFTAWQPISSAPTPPSSPGKDGGQEVEAVGYVSAYNLNEVKEGRVGCIYPSGTLRPEKEIPLYTRHQPTRMTNSADEIWIEPNPPADPNRGQDWSETNAWGQQATKYVRADVAETLMKALEPFAKVGEYILAEAPPEATLFTVFTDCGGNTAQVSLEYFREAIAALSASQSTSREK